MGKKKKEKVNKTATTSKPSKPSVTRNGNKFTATWKPKDGLYEQVLEGWAVGSVRPYMFVYEPTLSGKVSEKSHTINPNVWYPVAGVETLNSFRFRLKATHDTVTKKETKKGKEITTITTYKESSWSDWGEFKLEVPGVPKYIPVTVDNTYSNRFVYSWDRNASDGDINTTHKMFSRFEWQTCLVDQGKDPNWSLANTQQIQVVNATTGEIETKASHGTCGYNVTSMTIVEQNADIANNKTRYFWIKAVGPRGCLKEPWQKYTHQLGKNDLIGLNSDVSIGAWGIEKIGLSSNSSSTGIQGSINMSLPKDKQGDSIEIEYAIIAPYVETTVGEVYTKSEIVCPPGFDSWTHYDTFTSAGLRDVYTFNIPSYIAEDTQLFMRINTTHDRLTTEGVPLLVNKKYSDSTIWKGKLSTPALSVDNIDEVNHEVTVTVTNMAHLAEGGNKSFIAIYERGDNNRESVIGIVPYSDGSAQTKTCYYDYWATSFGVRAFVASYFPPTLQPASLTHYFIYDFLMDSGQILWSGDVMSQVPSNIEISKYDATTAFLKWEWSWDQADSTEVSWSTDDITWESTEEPSTYIVTNTRQGQRYIKGLSADTYHFKLRFIRHDGDITAYSAYSNVVDITMTSAPKQANLVLSDEDGVIGIDDEITASWSYECEDGTSQMSAIFANATGRTGHWTYTEIPQLVVDNGEQRVTFTPRQLGWTSGELYRLCVKPISGGSKTARKWSNPLSGKIRVAPQPVLTINGIGGQNDALISDDGSLTQYLLKKMPIEMEVSGAGEEGKCTVVIERIGDTEILTRPDDKNVQSFDGETIVSKTFIPMREGVSVIDVSIRPDDLLGHLDYKCRYRMIVSIVDQYEQKQSWSCEFTVDWNSLSQKPSATIELRDDDDIMVIEVDTPETVVEGDYCQIYRMSADRPQLVLDHGEFGVPYVDPYPTFGYFGGYRIVHVSKYGDYSTEDNIVAMAEYSNTGDDRDIETYDEFLVSIDFDGHTVECDGNVSMSSSWAKDFQVTRYLGGAIQGDWNPGVQRTGTINLVIPVEEDTSNLYDFRLLADYAGRCHVRTPDGSNFDADVQASDNREEKWVTKIAKISLNYSKVDAVGDQLIPLSEWEPTPPN